jgi:putative ABC transport system permease protein
MRFALRHRIRDWRTSLSFIAVVAAATAIAGAWIAIALPLITRALPFPGADRIVAIETANRGERNGLTWADMEELRGDSVESIAAFAPRTWGLQTEKQGHVEVVLSQQVTGDFFRTLGLDIAQGEPLSRLHELAGNQSSVWFSHEAWRRILGGTTDLSNRTVWINAVPYRLAGVLPAAFDFPHQGQSPDIYIPLDRATYLGPHGPGGLGVVARLQPGTSGSRFQAQLDARANELATRFPATNTGMQFLATSLSTALLGDRWRLLNWLLAAILVLVLIAIANAGGIWFAHCLRQRQRIAVQLALGASWRRVSFELLAEVLLLGLVAAAVGLLGCAWFLDALRTAPLFSAQLALFELWQKVGLNPSAITAIVALALGASLCAGLAPLLVLRRTATSRSASRVRLVLAAAQLVLTGTLSYAGITIGRNVFQLLQADPGFRTDQILVSGIGISESKYNTDEKMIAFHQQVIERLTNIPGVQSAAGGTSIPLSRGRTRFLLDSEATPKEQQHTAAIGVASPGALPLLEIPLRRGRLFADSDRFTTPKVALVNQAFADRYLPAGTDPLGHRLRFSFYNGFAAKPYTEHQIIGVVANTRNRELGAETEPQILISSTQMAFEGFQYFVRSSLPAAALLAPVRDAVWSVDPATQSVSLTPLSARVEQSIVNLRLLAWLLGLFAAAATLVVVFGLASSLAATFVELRRELGIRAALGASPRRLAYSSIRWAVLAVLCSATLTLPASVLIGNLLRIDKAPIGWDARGWLLSSLILAAIGIAAAWLPARRAACLNPADTLRTE